MREGAADETKTSRNHDSAAPVMLKIFRGIRQWSRESCHEWSVTDESFFR